MNPRKTISPEIEEILSRCSSDAEKIRIVRRLEAIAAAIWEEVFGVKKAAPVSLRRHNWRN